MRQYKRQETDTTGGKVYVKSNDTARQRQSESESERDRNFV